MQTLINAGQLITAVAGDQIRHNQGVLIENDSIVAIGEWAEFAPDETRRIIDASQYTVMPGLIDAHTHVVHNGDPDEDWGRTILSELPATLALKAARNARRQLEMGVTTIRDVGAPDWVDIALRDAINAGWQFGPRMLVAGHGITSTGGHMDARKYVRPGLAAELLGSIGVVADSPAEARRAAWEQLMRGADLLKLNATLSEYVRANGGQCSPELTYETMAAICEIAHGTGRKVAAHCHGGPGVKAALEAGVDTFEHGRFLSNELLDQMAEREVYLVPTLSPEARRVQADDPPRDLATRRWYKMATDAMYDTVNRASSRGVRVVAGSDAGMPYVYHGGIAFEMVHLARAGLSNLDALIAATQTAAHALGLGEQLGQLKPGFQADLLVVENDPTRDLAVLEEQRCILVVVHHGHIVVDRRQASLRGVT
jgi:imidazolonepropionase-like amidohydrolase